MKYFVTSYHTPTSPIWLALLLQLGCKGEIGAPGGLDTTEPYRVSHQSKSEPSLGTSPENTPTPEAEAKNVDATSETPAKIEQLPRFQCNLAELRGTNQLAVRRLTRDEYLQSAAAVFGATVMGSAQVQAAAAQIPPETTGDITREFQNAHSYEHVAGILLTSQAIAKAAVADAPTRERVFGVCAQHANRECAAQFLSGNALRILRRPLDESRRRSLIEAFSDAGEGNEGLELLLARVLQAPEAVLHIALPRAQCTGVAGSLTEEESTCEDDGPQQNVQQIDDWSVADRVSYALTGQGPDQELLDAAALGQLGSPDEVRPHAQRLVKSPEARRQLEAILDAWLNLQAIPTPASAVASQAGIAAADLGQEARRELLDYALYEILEVDADAQTLMSDSVGFPRSERMASLYGVSALAKGEDPIELTNGHGGLLMRIAPLLSGQLRTSPILRGVYVRKRVLCDELVSPDFAVVQARTEALHDIDAHQLSSRAIAQKITEPTECMACHSQINPLGFALEGFDALGARRDEELNFDEAGNTTTTLPVDTNVDHANIEAGAPDQLADAAALVRAIASSTKYQACIAERLYTHAQLRRPKGADICALSEVESVLRSGQSVKEAWLAAVLNPDMFVRRPETAQ